MPKDQKKVHRLDFDSELILIGIASHQSDYRVSWAINESLNFELTQGKSIEVYVKKIDKIQQFSVFYYETENRTFRLISNRCENGILIKKFKNIDFLLIITGKINNQEISVLIEQLKKIKIIIATYQISFDSPRKIRQLFFS